MGWSFFVSLGIMDLRQGIQISKENTFDIAKKVAFINEVGLNIRQ
jgi:hypothetical protein